MAYPKRQLTCRGSIVLDALLAAALAAAFSGALSASISRAEDSIASARERSELLDAYASRARELDSLLPGEMKEIDAGRAIRIVATARWYGNDRIETDISIGASSSPTLGFRAVRAYPFPRMEDAAGEPLCDVHHGSVVSIAPVILPIDPTIPLTALELRDGIAYVAADPSRQSDPDLFIVDMREAGHPQVLSSIDTGPGLASIALAGRYIFAAASSAAAQLHVIRIDSLSKLSLVAKHALPMPNASSTLPRATAIAYRRGIAYLGTERWGGDELSIIDVSSPESPRKLSGVEIGSRVNEIVADDKGMAYVAASNRSQFLGIDASDPSDPKVVWSFGPTGWQRQEGKVIALFEGDRVLGRTSGGFDIAADPELFAGSSTANIPGGVYGLAVDRDHVFAATRSVDRELSIYDRDLATSSARYYPLPVAPQAMTCDADKAYILGRDAPALYEISFSP